MRLRISFSTALVTALAIITTTVIVSCSTVPGTGRSQLLLISRTDEMQLGFSEFEKLKQSLPLSRDPAVIALVQRVGMRIAASASLPDAQWEFVAFEAPDTPNAFCLPGGKVGIYTGILPITQNEAGLAAVMGHEVAHAVARHGGERLSQSLLLELGGQALDAAMKTSPERTRALTHSAYGLGTTLGVALPYSRKHELEADQLGLFYMARAGYDPREAVAFWKRFADYNKRQGGRRIEFLSTHPLDDTRIAQLEKLMPRALQEYRASGAQ